MTTCPLLKECTELKQFIEPPIVVYYPNHTQSVERAVKLTTGSTNRIAGQKRQIGEALNTIAARKMPWITKMQKGTFAYVSRKAYTNK